MKRFAILLAGLALSASLSAKTVFTIKINDGGTGPYKAVLTGDDRLKDFTIYRPQNMKEAVEKSGGKLPVLLFGNGACFRTSRDFQIHLTEIASHGYFVVAMGSWDRLEDPDYFTKGDVEGDSKMLVKSLDILAKEAASPKSEYYQLVDPTNAAVSGQSCGGLQALYIAAMGDKRIKTAVPINSGLFNEAGGGHSSAMGKEDLKKIQVPLLYLIGGPADIAYENGMDDFNRIDHLPIVVGNLNVGHGGTLGDPNGGRFAQATADWLDMILRGKSEKKAFFDRNGTDPVLGWEFLSKHMDLLEIENESRWRSIEPSKMEAKVMTTLTEFSPEAPNVYYSDEVYATKDGHELKMAVLRPDIEGYDKLPCIVFVNGSAWFPNSRHGKLSYLMNFSLRGYTIISVEYRGSTVAQFPAQIQDVKSAVRYIRRNADRLGVDYNNLFIWGDSSGGNMALLETLTQQVDALDEGSEYGHESLAVNACVAFYPVTDLLHVQEYHPDYMDHVSEHSPTGILFGGIPVKGNEDKVKTASPIEYVSKDKAAETAPILIITGNRDNVLPYEQSVLMADKLEVCGYDYKFYKIENGDHGSTEFWSPEVAKIVDDFLKANIH